MWVRSQDKTRLIDVKEFTIRKIEATINEIMPISQKKELDKHVNEFVIKGNTITHLGYYSTEEKALKVLDRLERHIQAYLAAFQMPQDSEVK